VIQGDGLGGENVEEEEKEAKGCVVEALHAQDLQANVVWVPRRSAKCGGCNSRGHFKVIIKG
jgi:hypothetical protein